MLDNINSLINLYIKDNNREELWNLANKYENKVDLEKIANYYIKEKDDFYICELISLVGECLNLNEIFDKIIATKDEEFIFWVAKNPVIRDTVDVSDLNKLNNYFNNGK